MAAGLFPVAAIGKMGLSNSVHLVPLSAASTQIRHGALHIPFEKVLKSELPFDWLLDVHQNIFFKDGFQRNEAEDIHIMSIALKAGEDMEALQVSIQQKKIGLLWKEQYLTLEKLEPLQKIDLVDQEYDFQLASLEAGKEVSIHLQDQKSYFVQVLEGEVQSQGALLNPNTGLGLRSTLEEYLTFEANSHSRILIISGITN